MSLIKDESILSLRLRNLLSKNGFVVIDDLLNKYIDDFTDFKGFGPSLMLELKEFLLAKYKVRLKHRPKIKKKSEHAHKDCIAIIQHFCGENKFLKWGSEILMARKLLDSYNLDLILSVTPKYQNMKSLAYYMTRDGQNDLMAKLPKKLVEKPKTPIETKEIEVESYSGEIERDIKPKTLKDFFGIK